MIARAIENLFYTAAVTGTHKALNDMGMIPPEANGSPVEQVRAAIVGPAPVEAIADEPTPPATRKKGRDS